MTTQELLKRIRETRSRAEIVRETGISYAKITNLEKGRTPTDDEAAKISEYARSLNVIDTTEHSDDTEVTGEQSVTPLLGVASPAPLDELPPLPFDGDSTPETPTQTQTEPESTVVADTDLRPSTDDVVDEDEVTWLDPVMTVADDTITADQGDTSELTRQLSPTELTVLDGYRRYANSEVWTFKDCPRRWYLAYYRGLKLRFEEPTGPKYVGDRIHRALAAHYVPAGTPWTDMRDMLERLIVEDHTELVHYYHPEPVPLEVEQRFTADSDLERIMLDGYVQWLAENGADVGYTVVSPETYREAVLPEVDNVKLIAKLDVVIHRDSDQSLMWFEHKTKADIGQAVRALPMDEQTRFQTLVESLSADQRAVDTGIMGVLYNVLRRVKRSARAKPPFYQRVEVRHNAHVVNSMHARTVGTIRNIEQTRQALVDGASHHEVAYPRPTSDCAWKCQFYAVCGMMDDGSRAEDFINAYYESGDPYDYYTK